MDNREKLRSEALRVLENSYSPYSKIKVAAALLTKNGNIYTGINVENSSYALTSCAEKNAVMSSVTNGEKEFIAMAIVTNSELVTSPCGSCRQVIYEFTKDMPIYFYGPNDFYREYNIKDLLPDGFNLWVKTLNQVL